MAKILTNQVRHIIKMAVEQVCGDYETRMVQEWLDSLPTISESEWLPLEEGKKITCSCGRCPRTLHRKSNYIAIYNGLYEESSIGLPNDVMIIRRVKTVTGNKYNV